MKMKAEVEVSFYCKSRGQDHTARASEAGERHGMEAVSWPQEVTLATPISWTADLRDTENKILLFKSAWL